MRHAIPMRQLSLLGNLFRLLMLVSLIGVSGCSTKAPDGVTAVSPFDIRLYAGKWYEIARLNHSFEAGLTDVSARYTLQADGSVAVINRGYNAKDKVWKEATGQALFTGAPSVGSLKVSFFGPFYGGYHVIALDPAYRWAMVIGPDRDYLWILSRDKTVPTEVRERLLRQAQAIGVATGKLIWVSQTRADG
jgi:Bacterial lipocalin